MAKLFNLSLYESELEESDYLCEEDFKMSQDEINDILKGLEEGLQILEQLGRQPDNEVLKEKNNLDNLTKKISKRIS